MVPRRRVAGPCLAIAAIAALLSTAGAQAAERIGAAVLSTLGDKVPVRYLEANPECPTCVEVLDVSGVSILRVRDKATGKVVMVQDLGLSGTERLAEGPASWSSAGGAAGKAVAKECSPIDVQDCTPEPPPGGPGVVSMSIPIVGPDGTITGYIVMSSYYVNGLLRSVRTSELR